MRSSTALAALLALAATLAGCGGGQDETPAPAGNTVPPSATASTTAFVDYAGSLAPSETQAPLDLGNIVPPTSETEEPKPIG